MGRFVMAAVLVFCASIIVAMESPQPTVDYRSIHRNLSEYLSSLKDPEATPFVVKLSMQRQSGQKDKCDIAHLYYYDYDLETRERTLRVSEVTPKQFEAITLSVFPSYESAPNKEKSKSGFGCEVLDGRYYFLTIRCKEKHMGGLFTSLSGYGTMNLEKDDVQDLMTSPGRLDSVVSKSRCDNSKPGNVFYKKKDGEINEEEVGWAWDASVKSEAFKDVARIAFDDVWSLLCPTLEEKQNMIGKGRDDFKLLKGNPDEKEPSQELTLDYMGGDRESPYALFDLPWTFEKPDGAKSLSRDMWLQVVGPHDEQLCAKVFVTGRDPEDKIREVKSDDIASMPDQSSIDRLLGKLVNRPSGISFTESPDSADAKIIRPLFWAFVAKHGVPVQYEAVKKDSDVCFLGRTNHLIKKLLHAKDVGENDKHSQDILIWWAVHCGPSNDVLATRRGGDQGLAVTAAQAGLNTWARRFLEYNDNFCTVPFLDGSKTDSRESLLQAIVRMESMDIQLFETAMAKLSSCEDKNLVARVLDHKDKRGNSVLKDAVVLQGRTEVIRLLIDSNANPNIPDGNDCTPMHYAMLIQDSEKASEIMDMLLARMDEEGMAHRCHEDHEADVFGMAARRSDGILKTLVGHNLFSSLTSESSKSPSAVLPLMKIIGRPEKEDTAILYIRRINERKKMGALLKSGDEGRTLMTMWIGGVNKCKDQGCTEKLLHVLDVLFALARKAGLQEEMNKIWLTTINNELLVRIQEKYGENLKFGLKFGQRLANIVCQEGLKCDPVRDDRAIARRIRDKKGRIDEERGDEQESGDDVGEPRRGADVVKDSELDSGLHSEARLKLLSPEEQEGRRQLACHLKYMYGSALDVTKAMKEFKVDQEFVDVMCESSCSDMDYWGCDYCSRCGCAYCTSTKKCHSSYSLYLGSCSNGQWIYQKDWQSKCKTLPAANAADIPLPKVDTNICYSQPFDE